MRIDYVKIENYRNLSGVEIFLHPDINFIVGDNDIGKSNFLDMLDTTFNGRSFGEDNFYDTSKPISITFHLFLNDNELGLFGAHCNPKNANLICITAKQETPDDFINCIHSGTEENLRYDRLRCVNFIKYDSLRTPREEFALYRRKGVGKFLNYLSEKFIEENKELFKNELINETISSKLIEYFNKRIGTLEMFKEFNLKLTVEEDKADLLCRILSIVNADECNLSETGYGVQFALLIDLTILQKLMNFRKFKNRARCFFNDNDNDSTSISLILGLDEPEIHLHPYMQRNIIRYINDLINNKNKNFSSLIKEIFDIDAIFGQSIVVTQSPNILSDNYRNFVRFHKLESRTHIVNGIKTKLEENIEKHLMKQLPYIKESFFAKFAIVVEGDTELGAIPLWAMKSNIDLDKLGIGIIRADGKKSVPKVMKLLDEFEINNIGIVDRDNDSDESENNLFVTDKRDFDEELFDSLISQDLNLIEELVKGFETNNYKETNIQKNKMEETVKKYNIEEEIINQNYKFQDVFKEENENILKIWFLSWINLNKSITLGRTIGETLNQEQIPKCYKNVFKEAENRICI